MEPVEFGTSKSGRPTAKVGRIRIHSSYDPQTEAERFILSSKGEPIDGGMMIVLGAGLGYLDEYLARKCPSSRIIAVHLDSRLHEHRITVADSNDAVVRWHPGLGVDISSFLMESISETDISGLRVYRWPASVRAWPDLADEAAQAVTSLIRLYSGNISATAAFGRHWIRNMLRNYLELESLVKLHPVRDAVVLAASGPSLEYALEALVHCRNRYQLWALPSSMPALLNAGLIPDLIFTTDTGHWARIHMRHFPEGVPVAMPLSSAVLPGKNSPTLLLPQETPGESYLLSGREWPILRLPSMGTVAATAMAAWEKISSGPLLIAGLDMQWFDLRSHVRPHAFDGWLAAQVSRISPAQDVAWKRANAMAPDRDGPSRSGPSLRTYRDWFDGHTPPGSIYRVIPGKFPGRMARISRMRNVDELHLLSLPEATIGQRPMFQSRFVPESYMERKSHVKRLLAHWTGLLNEDDQYLDDETRELLYTLDPGGILEMERTMEAKTRKVARHRHIQRVRCILSGLESIYG